MLFLTYYLCDKYYRPIIIQYYVACCVGWVPRLTLLDLQTSWIYEHALRKELTWMQDLTIYKSPYLKKNKRVSMAHTDYQFPMAAA